MTSSFFSFYGDADPRYHGSVVKALASAKNGYKALSVSLQHLPPQRRGGDFAPTTVIATLSLNPHLSRLTLWAPLHARNAAPGQMFRLQAYGSAMPREGGFIWPPEGVPMYAHTCDAITGEIIFLVGHRGVSTAILAALAPGDAVALLGPVGCGLNVAADEVILIVGGAPSDLLLTKAQQVGAHLHRLTVTMLEPYILGQLDAPQPHSIDRVIFLGDPTQLEQGWAFLYGQHHGAFKPSTQWSLAVATPMHCMMQGVCGQCLQRHRASEGNSTYIYACTAGIQDATTIDMGFMSARLSENHVQEWLFEAVLQRFKAKI